MAAPSRSIRGPGSRTGASSGATIIGMKELRSELRILEDPRTWTRELAGVYRTVGKKASGHAQAEARSMGHEQSHFGDAIKGRGTVSGARLVIAGKAGSDGAFYGAKQFGQFNDWVGSSWDVAVYGQGPYALNSSLARHMPEYLTDFRYGIDSLTKRAFPD